MTPAIRRDGVAEKRGREAACAGARESPREQKKPSG